MVDMSVRMLFTLLFMPILCFCSPESVIQEPSEAEFNRASRDPINIDMNVSPALTQNEMYRDLLSLSSGNFTDLVLKSKDPWVVIFHDGQILKTWKNMAMSMRGIIWMGLVDINEEKSILKSLGLVSTAVPKAMVFPYNYFGNPKMRKEKAIKVETPLEARKRAVSTLPDNSIKLDKNSIQDFLIESYVGQTSKFPLIYMTYEVELPALLKAINLRFGEYFHLGVMTDPSENDLKALGLKEAYLDLPTMLTLVTIDQDKDDDAPELSAVFYDTEKMGDMNYPNIARYLFQMNERFRLSLPGNNMANDKKTATMSDILAIEKIRFSIDGLEEKDEEKTQKDEL